MSGNKTISPRIRLVYLLDMEPESGYQRAANPAQQDMRLITPMEHFWLGLASDDETCVRIYQIVRSHGFHFGYDNRNFYKIGAIKALFAIAEEYGYEVLDKTLFLIASAWCDSTEASRTESLLGVAEFVSRYGTADFIELLTGRFSEIYDYIQAARIRGSLFSKNARKKICRVIVDHYNRRLAQNSMSRLKWEG